MVKTQRVLAQRGAHRPPRACRQLSQRDVHVSDGGAECSLDAQVARAQSFHCWLSERAQGADRDRERPQDGLEVLGRVRREELPIAAREKSRSAGPCVERAVREGRPDVAAEAVAQQQFTPRLLALNLLPGCKRTVDRMSAAARRGNARAVRLEIRPGSRHAAARAEILAVEQ